MTAGGGRRLAVVGGGWAGIAAAVEGVRRGWRVTLFEMAPQLGGRARGIVSNGIELDNGQHILIGAYVETLALLAAVGVDLERAFLRMPLALVRPDGGGLQLGSGPPIAAFGLAVLRQRDWPLGERLALLVAAGRWAVAGFGCAPSLTVAELTGGLPARVRDMLIDPLCVAALNTGASEAAARTFLRVLKDALFAGRGSADLLLPRIGLSEMLPVPARTWLAAAGAQVRTGTRVARLDADPNGGWSLDGTPFDAVVLAASPAESARLAASFAPDWSASTRDLRHEPIVTVYAQAPGARLPLPMLALSARGPAQFVFDRGRLGGPEGLLAFVVSGARDWVGRGTAVIEAATLEQARIELGGLLPEPPAIVRTVTEKRATFRCEPLVRRAPRRVARGCRAAGDHVEGPYPATLEGAVRSGLLAVRELGQGSTAAVDP